MKIQKSTQLTDGPQVATATATANSSDDSTRPTRSDLHIRKPKWLKSVIPTGEKFFEIRKNLRQKNLSTVCEEAKCPNIGYCWNQETATIMILGDTCTRACRFCHVKTGSPNGWFDSDEPVHVADTCKASSLKYVVLTMVDRDDMPDGGASHVANVVQQVKATNPGIRVELLAGDFGGSVDALKVILSSGLDVYAHNVETIERLTPRVRDARASYRQSLNVLAKAKEIIHSGELGRRDVFTKSGLMLGLGENDDEILETLREMRKTSIDVDFITLGQYMRPTKKHLSVKRWVDPKVFAEIGKEAEKMGFVSVASSPLVRSSFRAREFYENAVQSLIQ